MMSEAYTAHVTMTEAKWTDKEGSTVTFKLPMKGMENQRNPFEKWTKRRKGHAGTRFMAAIVEVKDGLCGQLVYDDEVMLAGWNDSQTNGHTVKFWLCSDTLGHPFEGFERSKDHFYISLAELDDDQEVIDQKVRDKVESAGKRPSERVSYVAAMLCKNEGFWEWASEEYNIAVHDEAEAKAFMMDQLGLRPEDSRSIFDKNEFQAKRFHELIRKPFLEWQEDPF